MRYQDFKLTEDELFELNMSPSNLQRLAADINAQAGMEFEMIIPGASQGDEDYEMESEPDYEMDEGFPTGRGYQREVIDFFRGGDYGSSRSDIQRAIDQLDQDYLEWKGNEFDNWLNDNDSLLDDYLREELPQDQDESDDEYIERLGSNDRESEQARERAMDRMNEEFYNEDQFDEFLSDNDIRTMSDFGSQYNLDWPYYTYPDAPERGNISIDDVATDFSDAIGRPVNASRSYHGGTREAGKYVVEPDGSLEPDNEGDGGLEFVSPPLPLDEMLSDLDKVAKWASGAGAYTNDSTGLHMNVSVPNFDQDRLDYVKLAIFLGDEYVLKQFGRAGNTYCKSAMAQIQQTAKTNPDKVQTMLRQMQGNLSAMASKIVHTGQTSKYTSINTKTGYIEFRSPGGDWLGEYAADADKLKNTLLRFVVSLDIAMKPELYRQEYMKKLYKTLDQGDNNDTIKFFARFSAGELPTTALKAFVKNAQLQRQTKKELVDVTDAELPPSDAFGNFEVYRREDDVSLYRFQAPSSDYAWNVGKSWVQQNPHARNNAAQYSVRPVIQAHPEGRGRPNDPNGRYAIVSRRDPTVYQTGAGAGTPEYQFRFNMTNPAEQQNGRYILAAWAARNRVDVADYMIVDTEQWDRPTAQHTYEVTYTVNDGAGARRMRVPAANASAAMNQVRDELQQQGLEVESISADSAAAAQPIPGSTMDLARQRAAQGTSSLPPGNARWLVLDRNDQEVYSFINTTAQSDANQYARNWMLNTAPREVRDRGPFTIVPVT